MIFTRMDITLGLEASHRLLKLTMVSHRQNAGVNHSGRPRHRAWSCPKETIVMVHGTVSSTPTQESFDSLRSWVQCLMSVAGFEMLRIVMEEEVASLTGLVTVAIRVGRAVVLAVLPGLSWQTVSLMRFVVLVSVVGMVAVRRCRCRRIGRPNPPWSCRIASWRRWQPV